MALFDLLIGPRGLALDRHLVRARFLEGEEHQRVWGNITKNVPVYADYQHSCKGHRQIPLLVLGMV